VLIESARLSRQVQFSNKVCWIFSTTGSCQITDPEQDINAKLFAVHGLIDLSDYSHKAVSFMKFTSYANATKLLADRQRLRSHCWFSSSCRLILNKVQIKTML